jgi:hypothetical protein
MTTGMTTDRGFYDKSRDLSGGELGRNALFRVEKRNGGDWWGLLPSLVSTVT